MSTPNFLNVFNIATALYLLETGKDYAELSDGYLITVAPDMTVWVCHSKGVNLSQATLIQRLV